MQAQHRIKVWQRPDQRIGIIQPTNRYQSQTLIGALGWCLPQKAYVRFATTTNTDEFCTFIEALGAHVDPEAERPLLIVLDNHKSHRSFRAQWVMQRHGMQPLYLPSGASKYSSVERLWSAMKTHLVRILGQTLLHVGKRGMDMDDLRAACTAAFADVSLTARENLVFANRKDLLAVLSEIDEGDSSSEEEPRSGGLVSPAKVEIVRSASPEEDSQMSSPLGVISDSAGHSSHHIEGATSDE